MTRSSLRPLALLAILVGAAPPLAAQAAPGLTVRNDAERREVVVELGPVDLPAGSGHLQLPALHAAFPVDGWLHGYRLEMLDAEGREVPRRALHHVNIMSPQRRELFSQIMLRIGAAGQETDGPRLPRMMGYRVSAGDGFIITAMLQNPTERALRGVRLRISFSYTAAGTWLKPLAVLPFYLDVMPPASLHAFTLAPGRSSRSWEGRPAVAGRIIGVSGHLHRYGVSLVLEDVTAGKVIWDGRPILDADGEVAGMPTRRFLWRLGFPVRPD
ncbi:MAG TPA: hypothetical protein VEW03_09875, partial [Longimicrobiaceae bacterium]|nr:hypothetical protein [Longimicrobiaceae bacterium]